MNETDCDRTGTVCSETGEAILLSAMLMFDRNSDLNSLNWMSEKEDGVMVIQLFEVIIRLLIFTSV